MIRPPSGQKVKTPSKIFLDRFTVLLNPFLSVHRQGIGPSEGKPYAGADM